MPKSWPKSPVPFAWPAAAAVLAAACGVAPPPAPPAVGLLFRYCRELGDGLRSDLPASGAPIDRPGATATTGDGLGPAQRLRAVVYRIDDPEPTAPGGQPLDTFAATILADRGIPFRGGSRLLTGLYLADPAADPAALPAATPVAAADTIVGPGFWTLVEAVGTELPALFVAHSPIGLRLVARARSPVADEGVETVLLRDLALDERGQLTLERRGPDGGRTALVLRLDGPADAAATAAVTAALATPPPPAPPPPPEVQATELARRAVGAGPRRGALLAVAAEQDLPRCLDLLLTVDEPELIALAEGMPAAAESSWQVERAFYVALLPRLQRGELPPAAIGSLRRHFGVLALDPTGLEFALGASPTAAEFDAAVLAENERALDDRRARLRMAAADWLASQGRQVADYDPLAERAARRAAIAAYARSRR